MMIITNKMGQEQGNHRSRSFLNFKEARELNEINHKLGDFGDEE